MRRDRRLDRLTLCLALAALFVACATAQAQTIAYPSQRSALLNSSTTGAANTAVAITLTGVPNTQVRVYGISAFCSAGTSTVTIAEAAVTKFVTNTGAIGTTIIGVAWTPGTYTAERGATVVITLGTCGGGNTGTLNIFADRY